MSWNTLRPQIKTLLSTLSTFQEVSNYPKMKFNGYPAATVTPSDQTGDYETTKENVRTYCFIVRVFYETKNTGIETALDALEDIVDSVIDLFDKEDLKGSATRTVGISLPSGYTFVNIWATPSLWGEIPGEELLMAEIKVRVRINIDLTT